MKQKFAFVFVGLCVLVLFSLAMVAAAAPGVEAPAMAPLMAATAVPQPPQRLEVYDGAASTFDVGDDQAATVFSDTTPVFVGTGESFEVFAGADISGTSSSIQFWVYTSDSYPDYTTVGSAFPVSDTWEVTYSPFAPSGPPANHAPDTGKLMADDSIYLGLDPAWGRYMWVRYHMDIAGSDVITPYLVLLSK